MTGCRIHDMAAVAHPGTVRHRVIPEDEHFVAPPNCYLGNKGQKMQDSVHSGLRNNRSPARSFSRSTAQTEDRNTKRTIFSIQQDQRVE